MPPKPRSLTALIDGNPVSLQVETFSELIRAVRDRALAVKAQRAEVRAPDDTVLWAMEVRVVEVP